VRRPWMLAAAVLFVVLGVRTLVNAVAGPTSAGAASDRSILVGPGFSDVSPHQLVRTSGNVLYVVAPTCDSYPGCPNNTLRVYKANQAGTPTGFTERDSAHRPSGVGSTAVAIDGADTIHVAWTDRGGTVDYRTFATSTDTWGATTSLGATNWTTFGQGDEGVALALDGMGIPHVAYTAVAGGIRRVAYVSKAGGAWSAATTIDDAPFGPNQGAWHPTLAFYPNGDLLLAWFTGSFNSTPDGTIYFRTRDHASGTWGTRTTISGDTLMTTIDNGPSLLITPDGTAHVTFLNAGTATSGSSTDGDYVHYYHNSGSDWVANHPGGGHQITHDPSLGPGPNGTVRIYGHGWQGGPIDGHGDSLNYFEGSGVGTWSGWTLYLAGSFDSSVTTRWAQFFQAYPETLDVAFWADPYPNLLYVGIDNGVTGPPSPTDTPTFTATSTSTATSTLTATLTLTLASGIATATLAATATRTGTLTATATPANLGAPTRTDTPTVGATLVPVPVVCAPRPQVIVQATVAGLGRLHISVSTTSEPGASVNRLQRLRFERLENASVDIRDRLDRRTPFVIELSEQPTQADFFVNRNTPSAFTVHFVAEDDCGEWPTFVGAGLDAF
jgi:hypothetical protein